MKLFTCPDDFFQWYKGTMNFCVPQPRWYPCYMYFTYCNEVDFDGVKVMKYHYDFLYLSDLNKMQKELKELSKPKTSPL